MKDFDERQFWSEWSTAMGVVACVLALAGLGALLGFAVWCLR